MNSAPVLFEVKNLKKTYHSKGGLFSSASKVKAVRDVSFSLKQGETLAVVGESGCGKSTLARLLMRVESVDSGRMSFRGEESKDISLAQWQSQIQMIFQDPLSSLNPRKSVFQLIAEPLTIQARLSRAEIAEQVRLVMAQVGLRPDWAERYPHMLSGGQRQRVGIARALTLRPQILICDEPVSALDVSIQAQVLNILIELQDKHGMGYVFISHDLSVVRHVAHRILVMYLGRVVEIGEREQVLKNPRHPYTQALLQSFPSLDRLDVPPAALKGELPSPMADIKGCAFASRCPKVFARCLVESPELLPSTSDESAATEGQSASKKMNDAKLNLSAVVREAGAADFANHHLSACFLDGRIQ
jgi:dipeptide transport system ATP-binding protein